MRCSQPSGSAPRRVNQPERIRRRRRGRIEHTERPAQPAAVTAEPSPAAVDRVRRTRGHRCGSASPCHGSRSRHLRPRPSCRTSSQRPGLKPRAAVRWIKSPSLTFSENLALAIVRLCGAAGDRYRTGGNWWLHLSLRWSEPHPPTSAGLRRVRRAYQPAATIADPASIRLLGSGTAEIVPICTDV
jgi:hypothetical protein